MGEIRKLYQNNSNVEITTRTESDAVYPITSDSAVYHSQGWGTKGTDQTVDSILQSLNEGYQYVGLATPNTSPNIFDHKVFYIAGQSGLYPYFGGINVSRLTILRNNGNSWVADSVGITGGGGGDSPSSFTGYIGTTLVQSVAQEQDLYGIGDVHIGNQKRIYFGNNTDVYIEYTSNGFHFSKALYSDGEVAGGGLISEGSGGGGGGDSVSITNIDNTNHLADLTVNGQTIRICLNGYAAGGGGGVATETDPIFTASPAYGISASDISSWNNKVSNVQADWAQNNQDAESYIKNKPSIPPLVTEATVTGWGFTKNVGTITEIRMNGESKGTSGTVDLGTVLTSETDPVFVGSPAYTISAVMIRNWNNKQDSLTEGEDYLTPQHVINQINSSLNTFSGNLADVAFSGDYEDLINTPTIPSVPTNVSAFTNDAGYITQQSLSGYLTISTAASTYQTILSTSNKLNPLYVDTNINNRFVTDVEKRSWNNKASDNTVVHLDGYETITGEKYFLGGIIVDSTVNIAFGDLNVTLDDIISGLMQKSDFRFNILCKSPLYDSDNLNTVFDKTRSDYTGVFSYYAYVGRNASTGTAGTNGFRAMNNANALLTIGTYSEATTQYLYQMGLSSDGSIYFRDGYAQKSGDTWGAAFGNGYWKRLLWEDHNGDVSVNGDITFQKGKGFWLDSARNYLNSAYIVRGSGGDYSLYIHAGREADETTGAHMYLNASNVCPDNLGTNLGSSYRYWNNFYANRWYPDPTNAPTAYIEWDVTNQAFKINGPVYSTGQITAGGIYSNS